MSCLNWYSTGPSGFWSFIIIFGHQICGFHYWVHPQNKMFNKVRIILKVMLVKPLSTNFMPPEYKWNYGDKSFSL